MKNRILLFILCNILLLQNWKCWMRLWLFHVLDFLFIILADTKWLQWESVYSGEINIPHNIFAIINIPQIALTSKTRVLMG